MAKMMDILGGVPIHFNWSCGHDGILQKVVSENDFGIILITFL